MATLVSGALVLVGAVIVGQGLRSRLATSRWERTSGTVTEVQQRHVTDDGRRSYQVHVTYRDATGGVHSGWHRKLGTDLEERTGTEVVVWYDPRHVERSRVSLAGGRTAPVWPHLVFGGLLVLVAGAVLLRSAG